MVDLLTPSAVRDLLDRHGLAPRRAAGQNFVIDPNTVRRIVAAADLDPGDTVIEIGPGLGSLTLGLASAAQRVVAVEIDAGLVRALAETVGRIGNVEVVHADALAADLGALAGGGPARVVANLPYNVATPLIMHCLDAPAVTDLFVMVQREVGERWSAIVGDPAYAGISVRLALLAEARVILRIPRAVFYPVPNVDSVMVRIMRRDDAPEGDERQRLFDLVDAAFAQRRKTLRNNLRRTTAAAALEAAAARAGIDLGARAEEVSPDGFRALARALADPDY